MLQKRIAYFETLSKDEQDALCANDFTVSEIYELINETALSDVDRSIAELRYIKSETILQISVDVGLDEKTVQRRIKKISQQLKNTIKKLFA